jgi:hypothetical protein
MRVLELAAYVHILACPLSPSTRRQRSVVMAVVAHRRFVIDDDFRNTGQVRAARRYRLGIA